MLRRRDRDFAAGLAGVVLGVGLMLFVSSAGGQPQGGIGNIGGQNAAPVWNQGVKATAITPTNGLSFAPSKALLNGNATACNINMRLVGDTAAVLWQNVQAGAILPVSVIDIESNSTTCANLIAIY